MAGPLLTPDDSPLLSIVVPAGPGERGWTSLLHDLPLHDDVERKPAEDGGTFDAADGVSGFLARYLDELELSPDDISVVQRGDARIDHLDDNWSLNTHVCH